jgi:hypothetical protein
MGVELRFAITGVLSLYSPSAGSTRLFNVLDDSSKGEGLVTEVANLPLGLGSPLSRISLLLLNSANRDSLLLLDALGILCVLDTGAQGVVGTLKLVGGGGCQNDTLGLGIFCLGVSKLSVIPIGNVS